MNGTLDFLQQPRFMIGMKTDAKPDWDNRQCTGDGGQARQLDPIFLRRRQHRSGGSAGGSIQVIKSLAV